MAAAIVLLLISLSTYYHLTRDQQDLIPDPPTLPSFLPPRPNGDARLTIRFHAPKPEQHDTVVYWTHTDRTMIVGRRLDTLTTLRRISEGHCTNCQRTCTPTPNQEHILLQFLWDYRDWHNQMNQRDDLVFLQANPRLPITAATS